MDIIKFEKFKELTLEEKSNEFNLMREAYTCVEIAKAWGKPNHYVYGQVKQCAAYIKHKALDDEFKKYVISNQLFAELKNDFEKIIQKITDEVISRTFQ
jgi:predicted DNA-binding protein YlxM (UPF0122 family)